MNRIKLFGMMLMVAFVFTAIAAGSASAAEPTKVLYRFTSGEAGKEPTAANPVTFTGTSEAGELVTTTKEKITCTSNTDEGKFETGNLGNKGKITFKGCKGPSGSTCGPSGTIVSEGEVHFLLGLLMMLGTVEELVAAFVLLLSPNTKFNCEVSIIKIPVEVKGCVAGNIEAINAFVKTATVKFKEWEKEAGKPVEGEQAILFILPPEATKESACLLETEVNKSGKFVLSADITEAKLKAFEVLKQAVEVEFMNP